MKKIVAILIVMLSLSFNINSPEFSFKDYFDGEITYFNKNDNFSKRNLGFCYVSNVAASEAIGECMILENAELNSVIFMLDADIIKTEMVENEVVVYAYSSKIPTSVELFNRKVNLQIAYTESRCVIGWPLILGDF